MLRAWLQLCVALCLMRWCAPQQEAESEAAVGSDIRGRVLDVSKAEGILDLSLRPQLIPAAPPKGKKKSAAASLPQVSPRSQQFS